MAKPEPEPDLRTLPGRIQRGMNARGWRPAHLAKEAGLIQSKISRFLSGEMKTLDVRDAGKIARALSLRLDWLESGEGTPWLAGHEFPAKDPPLADGRSQPRKLPAKPAEDDPGAAFIERIDERYRPFALSVIQASEAHPATRGFPLEMRWETLESMAAKKPMEGHTSLEWFHFLKKALLEGPDVRIQLEPEDELTPRGRRSSKRRRGSSS